MIERVLPRGKDVDGRELILRPLRDRIEGPQRLDVVAEQLHAHRHRCRRRIHVEDAAAARERARLAHLGDRLVSEIEQPRRGLVPRDRVVRVQRPSTATQVVRCDGVLEQRAQRRDDGQGLVGRVHAPKREQPLMKRTRRGRADLERHRLALRERQHALFAEPAGELRPPATCALLARGDQHERSTRDLDQRGPRERARAGRRVGDADRQVLVETFGEGLEALAALREREDPAQARARARRRLTGH